MADTGAAKAKDAQQNKPDLTDQILYPKMEDWARVGAEIGQRHQSSQWELGDWIIGGETRFSKQLEGPLLYEQAEAFSGVARQSLYKYAYVARNVCIRMQDVCWAIHQLVAPRPEDEQKRWLHRAQANKLTVSMVRNQLNDELHGNDTPRLFSALVPLTQNDSKLPATSGVGVSVSPTATTVYVLTVTNASATAVTAIATVTVASATVSSVTVDLASSGPALTDKLLGMNHGGLVRSGLKPDRSCGGFQERRHHPGALAGRIGFRPIPLGD